MIYRTVNTDIWRDPWFLDLSPASKCLFMYLFTNQSVSACGAMEISVSQIAFETKMPAKKVEAELIGFGNKILWLPESNIIVVRNFYKHQRRQSSENFTKAAKKAMADIPIAAQGWLISLYPELSDTLPIPIPNPSPTLGDKETVAVTEAEAVTATEPEEPPTPLGDAFPPEFVEFWQSYPTGHGSKPKSLVAWKKVRGEHLAIMAGLAEWHRSERWQKGMVKAAEIFLRDRLWENPAPPGSAFNGVPYFPPGSGDAAVEAWKRSAGVN